MKGNPDISKHGFKKGQTGNPNGRPKKLPQLDVLLDTVLGEEKDGVTAAEAILKALRMKAAKGDVRAAEILLDRAYGKAKQQIDHTSAGEAIKTPLSTIIVPDQATADKYKKLLDKFENE